MLKRYKYLNIIILHLIGILLPANGYPQEGYSLQGTVMEAGSGKLLQGAAISVTSTGKFTTADEEGTFTIELPSEVEKIAVKYPGYYTSEIFAKAGQDFTVYLVDERYPSDEEAISKQFSRVSVRNTTNSATVLHQGSFRGSAETSFDQTLSGRVPGLHIVEHSGMPGHNVWKNIRGISSIFARNSPLVFVDGMIHEAAYPNNYIIEGFVVNPMDVVDFDDIVDVSILRVPEVTLGSASSNGIIYVNTEQRGETSASILFKAYGGVTFRQAKQPVLNADQFRSYFSDLLTDQGMRPSAIDMTFPWLNGGPSDEGYYRYNNNTDWQEEMYRPATMQKYYLFLKGGDDIATYNISSAYLRHGGPFDDWVYSRYNLRLNAKINITDKLSVTPNTKLSLSDTYLSNMGPITERNPVVSTLLKPPLMFPYERSTDNGSVLFPFDDVGYFNVSNPAVLVKNTLGSDRSFQLLTSANISYQLNQNLKISNIIGTGINNDRINIFIPDKGVVQLDSARNNPMDMVTEYRSVQNHTSVDYSRNFLNQHHLGVQAGIRYMVNTYKNNQGIDLNTPSDDFRSLGQGSEYEYLRLNGGELSTMRWISYFADVKYTFQDRYYLRGAFSVDASSVFNDQNRYNLYPAFYTAWRISSEEFMENINWLNDLKLRASYTSAGNMFSSIYQFSKRTYTGRRYDNVGVVIRDYNANQDLSVEKKSVINAGIDMTTGKKTFNLHLDYYYSMVNNLIINQQLPYNFGFTDYFDNGGKLVISGIEAGADASLYFGSFRLQLGANISKETGHIRELNFINPETEFITRDAFGAEYIASVGNPINAFYGYKTLGIYSSDDQANTMIGPNGRKMQAGDIIFDDLDGNKIINSFDKQIIGDPNPDLYGGFDASLAMGRFELYTLLTYSIGNDVYNYVRFQTTSMASYANQSIEVLERWKPGDTEAELPKASFGDPRGNNVFSDRWIEDGSYLRLRQIKLSYRIRTLFGSNKEALIYITGSNLLTWTRYSGYDPETLYLNDSYFMGIDYGKIPIARSVIAGIQLSL